MFLDQLPLLNAVIHNSGYYGAVNRVYNFTITMSSTTEGQTVKLFHCCHIDFSEALEIV